MKKYLLVFGVAAIAFTSCKKDSGSSTPPINNEDTTKVTLTGDISTNKTLDATKKYTLKGFVYVTSGATLTIPAGTVIMGDKASKGTLVVSRGGKIDAQGTATKPVIFTSAQPAGARSQGDWGGVILLGKAPINPSGGEAKIEGGLVPTAGGDEKKYIWFGGTDNNDNSGTMKYVRIEFAGIAFSPDNEINGLTMGGVGAGTTLSYIQVYRSGDDAFEWFGGTVNADHLVAAYTWDDDFDTDNGYSGHVQFGIAHRVPTIADQSGSNGFESDNDANGSTNAPQTKAMFSNMTIIGPIVKGSTGTFNANYQNGGQIRRNSSISIYNSLVIGFPIGIYIDGTKGTSTIKNTGANGTEGPLFFKNNIIAGCTTPWKSDAAATADSATWRKFRTQASNTVLTNAEDIKMVDPNKYSAGVSATAGVPNFLLDAASPAVSGADFTGVSGFQSVAYRGAFDASNDWTKGWTTWSAETTQY